MAKMLYALFILCFFALHSTATNVTIYITSAHDLTEKLSPGLNFSGTTLLVTNDLDFSNEKFAPIGASPSSRFSGVFNGQGHVISNLVMNTSESYVGLFGFSWGTTIRNIILDASCSVTCTHNSSETKPGSYVGSIIGYCEEEETSCIIRNNVNMGNVSFSGSEDGSLYLGGIAGYLSSRNEYFVKNLANYGPVTLSTVGEKTLSAYVGGIIGRALGGSLSEKCVLQNSLNFGALTVNCDSVKMLSIGGVVGYIEYGTIENCVSAGTIESNKDSEYIGMLAGYLSRSSYPYFYWDIAKYNKVCG